MDIVFQSHPHVIIGSNKFVNVPTILQYENIPLIEVGQFVEAGYSTRLSVYHSDGTEIAVVRGSRIIPTEAGKKAKVTTRHQPDLTVCELEGKPIMEMRRTGAAALKGWAELHAPGGVLIKIHDDATGAFRANGDAIGMHGMFMAGSRFEDCQIGVHVHSRGFSIGNGPGSSYIGRMGSAADVFDPSFGNMTVMGIEKKSGESKFITVTAPDEATARRLGEEQGIEVQEVW